MKDVLLNSIFIISLSIIFALFAGIYSYRKLSAPLKIMYYYTCVSTIFGGIISIMSMKGINNILLINLYSFIEFIIISLAFYTAFNSKRKLFIIIYILLLILVSGIYIVQTIKNASAYNNALKSAISLILVFSSVGYLINQFYKGELEGDKKPVILLALGTFMYFAASFLIVLAGSDNSLLSEIQVLWIYLIHSIFYLIFVIFLTFAFLICRKKSGHSSLY